MNTGKKILIEIKNAVALVDPGAEVILFGSRARGDYNDESDWDVLILTDKNVESDLKKKIIKNILPVELEYLVGISPIVKNRQDWQGMFSITPFFKEIEKDGIVL